MSYRKSSKSNAPMDPAFSHNNGEFVVFSYSRKGEDATPTQVPADDRAAVIKELAQAFVLLQTDIFSNVKVWGKGMAKASLRVNGLDDMEKTGFITLEDFALLKLRSEGMTAAQAKKSLKAEIAGLKADREKASTIEAALGGNATAYVAPDVDPLDEYLTGLGFVAKTTPKGTSYKLGSTVIGRAFAGNNAGKWMRRVDGKIVMLGTDEELQALINPKAEVI